MAEHLTVTQWLKKYENSKGLLHQSDIIGYGWYDWFCKESSLINRTKVLAPKIKKCGSIMGKKFCDTHTVMLKNNLPLTGTNYDDFRFCDAKTGKVIFTVVPKSGFDSSKGKSILWGDVNKFDRPLVIGTLDEVYKTLENLAPLYK